MTTEPTLPADVVLRNEFSVVELSYIRRGDSVSLLITDTIEGNQIALDSTELESLARAPHEAFRQLMKEVDRHNDNPAG